MADHNENLVIKQEPDLASTGQSESTIGQQRTDDPTFQNSIAKSQIPLMTVTATENNVVCKKEPQPETLAQTRSVGLPVTSLGSSMCVNTIKKEMPDSENTSLSSSSVSSANMLPVLKINPIQYSQVSMMTVNSGLKGGIPVVSALTSNTNVSSQNIVGNRRIIPALDGRSTGSTHNILLQQNVGILGQPRIPVLINNRMFTLMKVGTPVDVRKKVAQRLTRPAILSHNSPMQRVLQTNTLPVRNSKKDIYPVALRHARPTLVRGSISTNATTSYTHATVPSAMQPVVSLTRWQPKDAVTPPAVTRSVKIESVKKTNTISENFLDVSKNGAESKDTVLNPAVVETCPKDKLSGIELIPAIESYYGVKKISLKEMMEILDSGNNVMAAVKEGTLDFKRAQVFCDAAKKHGVCGLKTGIDNAFYTSLVSECITAFETAVFKATVANTLTLKEETFEHSETQTVTVKSNHVSDETTSLNNKKDIGSSVNISHCDNINPVDTGSKDMSVKHTVQLQLPGRDEEPTDTYDETDSLPKWNHTISDVNVWRKAVRKLCSMKIKPTGSLFCCYLCVHAFCSSNALNQHIFEVHFDPAVVRNPSDQSTCTHCSLAVTSFYYVKEHELNHHLSDFPCYFCGMPNNSRLYLLDHICNQHSEVFSCKFCSGKFKGKSDFLQHCWSKNHMQPVISSSYFCLYCDEMFSESTNLKSHLQEYHIDMPVPNLAEHRCSSCRHVFIDDQALKAHRSRPPHKKTLFVRDSSTLRSLSKQFHLFGALIANTKTFEDGMDDSHLYKFDFIWWKKYLRKVKGVKRIVSDNCYNVCYPYGELMYTCKLTGSLCHMVDKLPLVMDKLIQTAIDKFKPKQQLNKLHLTEGVIAVLSSIWAFGEFADTQESIVVKSNLRLFCRGPYLCKCVTCETPEMQIQGISYKYPVQKILRFCAMENVNANLRPVILDGILQIIFSHFPELDPSACLVSEDFWEMVVTVSRTPLLSKSFECVQWKPLPWNDYVNDRIRSFIYKCFNDKLDYGFIERKEATLKSMLQSAPDLLDEEKSMEVEVSQSKVTDANKLPSATVTSHINEFNDSDSHEPEMTLLLDVVNEPGHDVDDPPTSEIEHSLSSSGHIESSHIDSGKNSSDKESPSVILNTFSPEKICSLLSQLLKGSSLPQQMFDFKFWESEYGMNSLYMETVHHKLKERNEKHHKQSILESDDNINDTFKEIETKCSGSEPPMHDLLEENVNKECLQDLRGNKISKLTVSETQSFGNDFTIDKTENEFKHDSVEENSNGEPMGKKREELSTEIGCAKYFADEEGNVTVTGTSSSVEIESGDNMEPLVTNKVNNQTVTSFNINEDPENDDDDLDDQACLYDTEVLSKWKKSIVVPVVWNRRIFDLCVKDKVSVDLYQYCYLCSYRTHDSKTLHGHITSTHFESLYNGENFKCSHCFTKMEKFDTVRAHEIKYHLSEFPCYFCGTGFQTMEEMLLHICKKHSEMIICQTCNDGFFGSSEFALHLKQDKHQRQPLKSVYGCLYCLLQFESVYLLKTHLLRNHVDKPISNEAEQVCCSCRHVFLDDKALQTHRGVQNLSPVVNPTTLASIVKLPDHGQVKHQKEHNEELDFPKVSFKKRQWERILLSIKDAVRTVDYNSMTFHYLYGELVYNLEMSRAFCNHPEVLPVAMDKLVEMTLEKFVQIQGSNQLPLTNHVLKMLGTVFVSVEYQAFLHSIGVRYNLNLLSQKPPCDNMKNTSVILIRKLLYKFPYKKILRYCAVEDVNQEVMPCIIDGLVRFIFAEFPLLSPDECLSSEDFWQMVTLVSRSPLIAGLLKSLQLKLFPRNRISAYNIHSFLFKCLNREIQFKGIGGLSTNLWCKFYSKFIPTSCPTSSLMQQILNLEFWKLTYGIRQIDVSFEELQLCLSSQMTIQSKTDEGEREMMRKYGENSKNDNAEKKLDDVEMNRKRKIVSSCTEENINVIELDSPGLVKKANFGITDNSVKK